MNWKMILKSPRYVNQIKPVTSLFFWYALMIFIAWQTLVLLKLYPIDSDGVNIALPNIISTIGIISAILITFIFSKLYAEKSEIVARKKRLQLLSAKINSLRKISYILFKKNRFWNNKALLDKYDQFSKLPDEDKRFRCWNDEDGEQLSVLWGADLIISDIDDYYITYNRFNKKKYSRGDLVNIFRTLDDLLQFMQTKPEEFLSIEEFSEYDQGLIIENVKVINESESIKELNNNTLRKTLEDYRQVFLDEHYILLALNSPKARRNFYLLLLDLLVFVVLIIAGLIFLNINVKDSVTLFVNQLIVSVFVASVIDILKNIFSAIRFEFKAYGIREH